MAQRRQKYPPITDAELAVWGLVRDPRTGFAVPVRRRGGWATFDSIGAASGLILLVPLGVAVLVVVIFLFWALLPLMILVALGHAVAGLKLDR